MPWKDDAFAQLQAQKDAIELEVGGPLTWVARSPRSPERLALVTLEGAIDPLPDENRDKVKDWFATLGSRFYLAFGDRVKALEAPASPAEEAPEEPDEKVP